MAAIIYLDIAKMPGKDGNVCVHSFTVNPLATDNKWKDNYEVAGPIDTARLKVAELCRVTEEIELPNGSQIVVFTTNESVTEDGNRFISRQGQEPAQNTDLWQKLKALCQEREWQISFGTEGILSEHVHENTCAYISHMMSKLDSVDQNSG